MQFFFFRYQSRPVPLVSVEEVNQWVENATKGHISNFLESIPHDVVLMLMNAVYFKGEATHQRPFTMVTCSQREDSRCLSRNVSVLNYRMPMIIQWITPDLLVIGRSVPDVFVPTQLAFLLGSLSAWPVGIWNLPGQPPKNAALQHPFLNHLTPVVQQLLDNKIFSMHWPHLVLRSKASRPLEYPRGDHAVMLSASSKNTWPNMKVKGILENWIPNLILEHSSLQSL